MGARFSHREAPESRKDGLGGVLRMDGGLRDTGVPKGLAVGPGLLALVSVTHWDPRCLCEKCRFLASFPRDSDFVGLTGVGPANLFILYVHPG